MKTRLDTDLELDDLIRAADPMRDPRVRAGTGPDPESALRLLAADFERSAKVRGAGRQRRAVLRVAVLVGAVTMAAFVMANITSTGNGSAVSPAEAQTILRHLRDALVWPPAAIYEEDAVTRVTAPDGATSTSGYHEWLSTSPPYNNRLIQTANGKIQWEQAFVNNRLDVYDPATNTVYLAPAARQSCSIGTTAAPAHPGYACQVADEPQWNSALSEVQYLLRHPSGVTMNPNTSLDGAPAIELTFARGRFSYWISAHSYQPLRIEDRHDSLPDGQAAVGITRYPIARVLTGAAASPRLLSLQAELPGATIDHSRTDYADAVQRILGPDALGPTKPPPITTTTTAATTITQTHP